MLYIYVFFSIANIIYRYLSLPTLSLSGGAPDPDGPQYHRHGCERLRTGQVTRGSLQHHQVEASSGYDKIDQVTGATIVRSVIGCFVNVLWFYFSALFYLTEYQLLQQFVINLFTARSLEIDVLQTC